MISAGRQAGDGLRTTLPGWRPIFVAATLAALFSPAHAQPQQQPQPDLPKRDDPSAPMDFEPTLKLYDVKPEPGSKTLQWETPLPDAEKARTDAERAQRKADRWQQLQKRGVLSKAEAEQAAVQASRALLRAQQAQVAALRTRLTAMTERAARGEASPDLLTTAKTDLARAEQRLAESESLARRNDLEFAEHQVDRQRKLNAAGIGSKTLLRKAQAELDRAKTTPAPTAQPQ